MPSILHLSSHLPSLPALSLSAISTAAIAAKFYRVSHLNRQNISPGIQPQWAACLPACLPACFLSPHQREEPYQAERSPTVGEDDAQKDTDKYLSATHPLLLLYYRPPERVVVVVNCCFSGFFYKSYLTDIKQYLLPCSNIV